jgi:hypothetical protein
MRRVVVHIDRLVLRGVAAGDAAALSAGLRTELQFRLGSDGAVMALSRHQAFEAVRAGTVRVPHGGGPEAVGRAAAGRIVRGEGS